MEQNTNNKNNQEGTEKTWASGGRVSVLSPNLEESEEKR